MSKIDSKFVGFEALAPPIRSSEQKTESFKFNQFY